MIDSYDQTEITLIILFYFNIICFSFDAMSREKLSFLLRHLLQMNYLLIILTDTTCKFILMSCDL